MTAMSLSLQIIILLSSAGAVALEENKATTDHF